VSDHAPTASSRPASAPARGGEVVRDQDGGSAIPPGFGLAVISGLADDVRVLSTSSGVSVRMSWPSAASAS
jgi:hypothetical protein